MIATDPLMAGGRPVEELRLPLTPVLLRALEDVPR
jgi:hypothetical protein